jgi:RimJ/RimL family protein N-acetyltransferase
MDNPTVLLEPWSDGDFDLLRRINAPEMTAHLGGPETEEQLFIRHQRYVHAPDDGTGQMFRTVLVPDGVVVGSIGYWERTWQDETVFETGWSVLPEYQGRRIGAASAKAVVGFAAATRRNRHIHAFPSVGHPASNSVCERAGFTFVGECDFEYPPGNPIRCNDWRYDLSTVPE